VAAGNAQEDGRERRDYGSSPSKQPGELLDKSKATAVAAAYAAAATRQLNGPHYHLMRLPPVGLVSMGHNIDMLAVMCHKSWKSQG